MSDEIDGHATFVVQHVGHDHKADECPGTTRIIEDAKKFGVNAVFTIWPWDESIILYFCSGHSENIQDFCEFLKAKLTGGRDE